MPVWLKPISLVVLFLILATATSFAEPRGGSVSARGGWYFNILGGFSFAGNKGESTGSTVAPTTGIAFGFGIENRVSNQLALELEFLNVEKNHDLVLSSGSREAYKLAFLETPFLVKWLVSPQFQFKFGPYLSALLLAANREANGQDDPVKGEFRNDYGMTFGVGFSIPVRRTWLLGLDLRYDYGMADIQKDNQPASRILTRSMLLLFNLSIPFK